MQIQRLFSVTRYTVFIKHTWCCCNEFLIKTIANCHPTQKGFIPTYNLFAVWLPLREDLLPRRHGRLHRVGQVQGHQEGLRRCIQVLETHKDDDADTQWSNLVFNQYCLSCPYQPIFLPQPFIMKLLHTKPTKFRKAVLQLLLILQKKYEREIATKKMVIYIFSGWQPLQFKSVLYQRVVNASAPKEL